MPLPELFALRHACSTQSRRRVLLQTRGAFRSSPSSRLDPRNVRMRSRMRLLLNCFEFSSAGSSAWHCGATGQVHPGLRCSGTHFDIENPIAPRSPCCHLPLSCHRLAAQHLLPHPLLLHQATPQACNDYIQCALMVMLFCASVLGCQLQ